LCQPEVARGSFPRHFWFPARIHLLKFRRFGVEMNVARVVFAVLLLLVPVAAQSQTLRGTIVDDATGEPVAGAMVTAFLRDFPLVNARSDSAGVFVLVPGRSGAFTLRITHVAYATIDSMALNAGSGEVITLEVRLGRTVVPLEPLVVTARTDARLAGFEQRRRTSRFGTFIDRSQIEVRPGARTTDLLRMTPGVTVVTVGRGGDDTPTPMGTPDVTIPRTAQLTMRSAVGTCLPAVFLDGMRLQQFEDSGIDDFLRPEMIEGVEIYPQSTGAPVEFIDPAGCGSIVFWSRGSTPGTDRWLVRAVGGFVAFVLLVTLVR
jgi:hypothetical protein